MTEIHSSMHMSENHSPIMLEFTSLVEDPQHKLAHIDKYQLLPYQNYQLLLVVLLQLLLVHTKFLFLKFSKIFKIKMTCIIIYLLITHFN